MPENKYLEDISKEEFERFANNSIARSKDGKMIIIKKDGYWEILCAANTKPENPQSRYLCVTYNEKYLGNIFGRAVNSYTNFISAGDTIARHFHKNFKEIFRVESLDHPLAITLKNPQSGKKTQIGLSGKLVEFEGGKWLREVAVPEGIAHMIHNPGNERTAIAITTSGQHDEDDVFPFEDF